MTPGDLADLAAGPATSLSSGVYTTEVAFQITFLGERRPPQGGCPVGAERVSAEPLTVC